MWLNKGPWDEGIILDYQNGSKLIDQVFKSGKGKLLTGSEMRQKDRLEAREGVSLSLFALEEDREKS